MSKRKKNPEAGLHNEGAALPTALPEEAMAEVDVPAPIPAKAPEGPANNLVNLFAHEDFEVLPKVPRTLIFMGDTIDLVRLTPAQFKRVTTTEAGKRIVRKR